MEKLPVIRTGKSFALPAEQCKYNCRIKLYPTANGDYIPVEQMTVDHHIFNPDGVEYAYGKVPKIFSYGGYIPDEQEQAEENKQRNIRRAKAKLYDIIRCNLSMDFFVTLTFSPDMVENRQDYSEVISKVNVWLNNRVKRNGLLYAGVVERHKKGGLHFHFLMNGEALKLTDSGTVKCNGHAKPIKQATADRYHIALEQRKTVYNVSDWTFGFSTALPITDDEQHAKTAHYLVKYLTKDFEKIGGRYYYSGGKLLRPRFEYCNYDYNNADEDYSFTVGGSNFKVVKLNE